MVQARVCQPAGPPAPTSDGMHHVCAFRTKDSEMGAKHVGRWSPQRALQHLDLFRSEVRKSPDTAGYCKPRNAPLLREPADSKAHVGSKTNQVHTCLRGSLTNPLGESVMTTTVPLGLCPTSDGCLSKPSWRPHHQSASEESQIGRCMNTPIQFRIWGWPCTTRWFGPRIGSSSTDPPRNEGELHSPMTPICRGCRRRTGANCRQGAILRTEAGGLCQERKKKKKSGSTPQPVISSLRGLDSTKLWGNGNGGGQKGGTNGGDHGGEREERASKMGEDEGGIAVPLFGTTREGQPTQPLGTPEAGSIYWTAS
ncbi:hypothetical protein VTK73DRAFT_9027 [Phialemonium thermophilum]|uniref:Uncharacterized protein n=1 Tax=Phialemonium thermophilum TaxID=223376 RepID=A0ABR3W4Y1_9PEZI